MSSFKRLKKSDIITLPVEASKEYSLDFADFITGSDKFTIYKGKNLTGSFDENIDPVSSGEYERLIYNMINHTYYQSYSASLNTHSLSSTKYYESASEQRPTGSYFVYNENPKLIKRFPTGSNQIIRVLSFKQSTYGNRLKPNYWSYRADASANIYLVDDGYGNVWDVYKPVFDYGMFTTKSDGYVDPIYLTTAYSSSHVGNIFYDQGLVIVTAQAYISAIPMNPNTTNLYFSYLNTQPNKTLFNLISSSYTDSQAVNIDTSSISITSVTGYNFPSYSYNNGIITLPTQSDALEVTPGIYKLKYTVSDTEGNISYPSEITLNSYGFPLSASLSGGSIQYVCNPTASFAGNNVLSIDYGIPPYSIQITSNGTTGSWIQLSDWYQPQASANFTTGSYSIEVLDTTGNSIYMPWIVTPKISFESSSLYPTTCSSSVSVTNVSGGTYPYTCSLISGSTTLTSSITTGNTTSSFSFPNYSYNTIWRLRLTDNLGCYNDKDILVRGRYMTGSGVYCAATPNNINWILTSSGSNGVQLDVYVNNIFVTSSVSQVNTTLNGNYKANSGDMVTMRLTRTSNQNLNHFYTLDPIQNIALQNVNNSTDVNFTVNDWNTEYTLNSYFAT